MATEKPCSEVLLAQISCLSRAGENGGKFCTFCRNDRQEGIAKHREDSQNITQRMTTVISRISAKQTIPLTV